MTTEIRRWIALCETAAWLRIYRGEYTGNKGGAKEGAYYSSDREFARQFTQSGQDHEIKVRWIRQQDVYDPPETIYAAGDEDAWQAAIDEAKALGFKAVKIDEGHGQPISIFVFDRSALRMTPR